MIRLAFFVLALAVLLHVLEHRLMREERRLEGGPSRDACHRWPARPAPEVEI